MFSTALSPDAEQETMIVAGIDVGKESLFRHVEGGDDSATNDRNGDRKIDGLRCQHRATRVILEASGRFHRGIITSLLARL